MTPRSAHTHARRRRWRLGTPLVLAASGALFMVSATNSQGTDLRPGRTTDLAGLVRGESRHLGVLQDRVQSLQEDIDRLSASIPDGAVQQARARAEAARAPAGLEPVSGTAVTVTLTDSPRELREGKTHDELMDMVVHEGDITAVVNAMWDAGAEAVTVQGRRVISTTSFKCAGSSVEINGQYYPQPFVITAVGDQERIQERIDEDPYLAGYRRQSRDETILIGWQLESEPRATAPAYEGLLDLQYARPIGS